MRWEWHPQTTRTDAMKTSNSKAVCRLLTAACLYAFQHAMPAPKALELAEERTAVQRALESAPAFAEVIRGKRKIVAAQHD